MSVTNESAIEKRRSPTVKPFVLSLVKYERLGHPLFDNLGVNRPIIEFRSIVLTALLLCALTTFGGCDYARMKEQEALQTYREQLPEMPENSVPTTGGLQALRKTDPGKMINPLPFSAASIQQGREGYGHYCIMCHGSKADGNGTVGQSFYPLPTNLRSPPVQSQSDGRLFFTLTFGFKRHPALGFMLTEEDRWAIVHYIRSLKQG